MKFNPKPGDKIICNNGEEFICCTLEFVQKEVSARIAHAAIIVGVRQEHGYNLWQDWNEDGTEGDRACEEYNIREVIPKQKEEDMQEVNKEEPKYTVEEVFSAIKQYVGYESPLSYKDGIKNLLKNLDEDPQYKEYLRLKAIYE